VADSNVIPCAGLQTDPNAAVPPLGGMRRAVNVVIDALGVATARPNFRIHTTKGATSMPERVPHAITTFGEQVAMISRGLGADDGDWFFETDTQLLNNDVGPPEITLSHTQFAKARRNLYFTTEHGIFKWTGAGFAEPAGMAAPGQVSLALSAGVAIPPQVDWFAPGDHVAYRVCFVKVDANDLETRSAPSSYVSIENDTAGQRYVVGTLALPPYAVPGDRLEVYRSLTVPTPPPADSMFLSLTIELEPADITAGFIAFVDGTASEMLGQMLYTSAGREGIEGANYPPPVSVALATWNDSLWCGATTGPATLAIDLVRLWVAPGPISGILTTLGSPTLTLPAPNANVRPGQYLYETSGTAFPVGARVLSVVGTAVTLDTNATVSGGTTIEFADVFELDGLEYLAIFDVTDYPNRVFAAEVVTANPGEAELRTARGFAQAINLGSGGVLTASVIETVASSAENASRIGRILITRNDLSDTTPIVFDESAATVDAFDPADPVRGFEGGPEVRPNRIAYSKPQEPEHFRLLDWIEMGREDAHVLAFAPLALGLLVFKEDGIWSVSGSYPTFVVDKISEAVLLRGGCADTFEDTAYAWTDRGMLAMSERGTLGNLSDTKIREEVRVWLTTYLRESATNTTQNAWLVCWDARSLVLLGSTSEEDGADDRTYCYSTLTGEWTTWDVEMRHPAYDDRTGRLIHGRARDDLWELRESLDVARGYDHDYLLGGLVASGTLVTVDESELDGWLPRAGDWIQRAEGFPDFLSEWRRILAVEFSGPSSWLLTIDEPYEGTGAIIEARAREGSPAVLEWQRHGMTPPSNAGFIRELQVHLDVSGYQNLGPAFDMGRRMRVIGGAHSDRTSTLATLVSTPAHRVAASRPIRFGVPRAHARSTHLYPHIEVNEGFRWRCLGIALVGEVTSSRLTRGLP
jgi:hypothetical protein